MRIELISQDVSTHDVQACIQEAWSEVATTPAVKLLFEEDAIPTAPSNFQNPFVVSPGEDAYDVGSLILIAAAGRLASSLPERLIVRLFDELIWPKLEKRFGSGLTKNKGDE